MGEQCWVQGLVWVVPCYAFPIPATFRMDGRCIGWFTVNDMIVTRWDDILPAEQAATPTFPSPFAFQLLNADINLP